MRQLKSMVSLVAIFGIIVIGVANAQAGILMSDFRTNPNPCTETEKTDTKVNTGIIVTGFTVIFGRGVADTFFGKVGQTNCGIIVTG